MQGPDGYFPSLLSYWSRPPWTPGPWSQTCKYYSNVEKLSHPDPFVSPQADPQLRSTPSAPASVI